MAHLFAIYTLLKSKTILNADKNNESSEKMKQ